MRALLGGGVRRPCLDTPEQLWISDFPVSHPGGNQQAKGRFPWTTALESRALRMREAGDTWREVALALAEKTGVRMGDKELAGYMQYHYDEA